MGIIASQTAQPSQQLAPKMPTPEEPLKHTDQSHRSKPEKPPRVLVIQLQDTSFTDSQLYKRLRRKLRGHATLKVASTLEDCSHYLDPTRCRSPRAILLVDAGAALHKDVAYECARIARLGGRVVCCANFANYMPDPTADSDAPAKPHRTPSHTDVRPFFARFGVRWELAGFGPATGLAKSESTGYRWDRCRDALDFGGAWWLGNVREGHAMYQPAAEMWDADQETAGFEDGEKDGLRVSLKVTTPVACSGCGDGYVGYVGDVNAQVESDDIILAMCGLPRVPVPAEDVRGSVE